MLDKLFLGMSEKRADPILGREGRLKNVLKLFQAYFLSFLFLFFQSDDFF